MPLATCFKEAVIGMSCLQNFDNCVSLLIDVIGYSGGISRITSKDRKKSVPRVVREVRKTILFLLVM